MIEDKSELNWRLFWNTRKELVLAILFFIVSIIITIVGIIQQIAPIKADLQKLKSKEEELAKFYDKAQQLQQLAIDPQFSKSSDIDKVLPSHKPLLEILSNLNDVANNTEVVIKNFSLNPGEIATDTTKVKKNNNGQKYDYLDLDFSVSGPLWKIQSFLSLIEQVAPISTITSISISRNIDQDKNAQAQADLILRSFYFTQPIKTTITSPLPVIAATDRKILNSINELIPNNLAKQDAVITGDRGNLFGLQDLSIEELEQELSTQNEGTQTTDEEI
jgi:Tfp pilus assembly protein PilO